MSVVENNDLINVSPPIYNNINNKFEFKYRHSNDDNSIDSYPDILIHNPLNLFQQQDNDNDDDLNNNNSIPCLGILNQKINLPISIFIKLWNNSNLKVCADGGANQLYNYLIKNSIDPETLKPDFIIGDLDSIDSNIKKYYNSINVPIKLQSSQYFTDLDKLISIINLSINYNDLKDLNNYNDIDELEILENLKLINNSNKDNTDNFKKIELYLIGSIGGRFDQTIHSINQLIKNNLKRKNFKFYLFNSNYNEIIILLNKGYNFIHLKNNNTNNDNDNDNNESHVQLGLLPLYKSTHISTHGLKWDVDNWETCMDGNISSSNLLVGNTGFYVYSKDNPIFLNISY
ncbi:transferase activity, transferring phosphorus-containing groups protein [[Candida] boidinii]|nr:transferase activity, transferring phosphorus-containing groups protein [[Candida] boidinii]